MTQMTSVHIKPCNIGQSEAHNQRTKAHLDHINAEKLYIRKDLIPENQSWTSELQGDMTLRQYYDAIGRMVKEKTGRAMQSKERERINKKTGKSYKLDNEDISLMQDMAAEALEMKRGVSKLETGKLHLERNDYIVAKQKRELDESKKQAEKLAKENEQKVLAREKLDKEIHDKQMKANWENGSAILSGLANLAGKGKYAQLEAENMAMRQQVALLPKKITQGVVGRTAELEKAYERERLIAELRLEEYNKLTQSYNRLLKKSQSDKKSYETALSQKNCIITNLIYAFQKAIELLDTVCRKVLKAVIDFSKKPIARRFTFEQACAVKESLDTNTDRQHAAYTLSVLFRPFLTEKEHAKGGLEMQNVVNNFSEYERVEKEKQRRNIRLSHGMKT